MAADELTGESNDSADELPGHIAAALLRVQREIATAGSNTLALTQKIADRAVEITSADRSLVGFIDSDDLVITAAGGAAGLKVGLRIPAATGFLADCVRKRVPVPCELDNSQFTTAEGYSDIFLDAYAVPLISASEVLGILIARPKTGSTFGHSGLYALQMLAGMLTSAMIGARMVQENESLVLARTRALEQVQLRELRHRALIENVADPIVIVDQAMKAIYSSPATARVTGYSPGEMKGRELSAVHPDDIPGAQETMRSVLASPGIPIRSQLRIRHRDGRWLDIETVTTNLLDHQAVHGIVVNLRDVSEQKRTHEAVARLAAIVESSHDAVIATDLSGKIVSWNPGAERIYGHSESEVLGMRPGFLTAPGDSIDMDAIVRETTTAGITASFESMRVHKDGHRVLVSVGVSPIKDKSGRLIGAAGISRDVTEHRRLEDEFRQAQKMEAIGRLAGGIAHDFNNILTAISANAELAMEDLATDHPVREDLAEIRRAGARAAALTRQLLAFSRKQVLKPQTINLNTIVHSVEEMLRRVIGEDVELRPVLLPTLSLVRADPTQLEQVLMNLAVNARDAMPRGGRLTIATSDTEFANDSMRPDDMNAGHYVVLEVTDTGIGMDAKTRARIFEPFFTTKEPGKGTGLGLSTVYGIVRQSGGFITLDSEPDEGTSFKLFFPRVEEIDRPQGMVSGEHPRIEGGSETLLLVEDEAIVRTPLKRALERLGYTVLAASNGVEALAIARTTEQKIDMLVSDVVMPGMGGRELADNMRAMNPSLPVLFMSGHSDEAVASHGALATGAGFMAKPFAIQTMVRRIREVLDAVESEAV
ncbi:MAG: PAS domain S-box protein [Gemmatimonadaceae bacterium]|nr:PAS domain S-box protein [Gemmatimonadaceae bacterium]